MMRFLWVTLLCALPVLAMSGNDNYPTGAAPAGFGNASVACSGLWAVHYNQAGMAYLSQALAGISYENRFTMQGLGIKSLAFALPLKNSAFGMEVVSFGYAKYGESKYGLSYARKLGDNFAAGLQLDYLFTHIAENYGSHGAFAVEAGILAHLTDKLHAGAHLYNPTRTRLASFLVDSISDYTEYAPTILNMGIDYTFSEKVHAALEVEKDIDRQASLKAGVEYHISAPLYLRLGISTNPFLNSFGFGVEMKNLRIDFATSYHTPLGYSPAISIQYAFK